MDEEDQIRATQQLLGELKPMDAAPTGRPGARFATASAWPASTSPAR